MSGPLAKVRYRTGCLSIQLPIVFLTTILFALAAFRPSLADELSDARGGAWLRATHEFAVAGINIPVAVFAAFIFYETWRMVLRVRDSRVLVSDEQRIHFHPTQRRKPIEWKDVSEVRHHESLMRSDLYFVLLEGRSFRLRNCDEAESAEFVEAARSYVVSRSSAEGDEI